MNLREIQSMQNELEDKIHEASGNIDPKMLGFLTLQDIFNDKYADDCLLQRFDNEVQPLINEYRIFIQVQIEQYLLNFINDVSCLVDSTGYNSRTGEETSSFKTFGDIPDTYVPCLEIESIWNSVQELRYTKSFVPFWRKHGYMLQGNNESINVVSGVSPSEFIANNRSLAQRSFGDTNLGRLERAIRWKDSKFDYPVYIPALTNFEQKSIPASYEESIRRHLILKHAMEHNIDGIVYTSIIDGAGNITLVSIE